MTNNELIAALDKLRETVVCVEGRKAARDYLARQDMNKWARRFYHATVALLFVVMFGIGMVLGFATV